MTAKRTTEKGPDTSGPASGADIADSIDRAVEAQHVGKLFEILPEEQLPGLYKRLRQLAVSYLEPAGDVLTPSQESAAQLLSAADDLLAAGSPVTDHARAWRAGRQRAAVNWTGRLNASSVARDAARQAGTRKPKRPEMQAWIDEQVARGNTETAAELWQRAPEWITDDIGFDRFRKRVTAAKKAGKVAASK